MTDSSEHVLIIRTGTEEIQFQHPLFSKSTNDSSWHEPGVHVAILPAAKQPLVNGRIRPHLAGFCFLRIPIFYHSYVRILQNGHYLVLTKEQEGGAFLATTGHDFVGTINGKK